MHYVFTPTFTHKIHAAKGYKSARANPSIFFQEYRKLSVSFEIPSLIYWQLGIEKLNY